MAPGTPFSPRLPILRPAVPIGPSDQDALKGKPEPQAERRGPGIQFRVQSHVHIRRKDRDQQSDQSPCRQPGPPLKQQKSSQSDLRHAAEVHQRHRPWQIGRHDAHIKRCVKEMVRSGRNKEQTVQPSRDVFETIHRSDRICRGTYHGRSILYRLSGGIVLILPENRSCAAGSTGR